MKKNYIFLGIAFMLVVVSLLSFKGFGRQNNSQTANAEYFSTNINGLPDVKSSQIVELKNGETFNMTAGIVKKNINGSEVKMLAYNGSIPGPTIKVPQGAEITIHFTNQTDVATTLHSHGVRLDNQFDGLPDITQKPIEVGQSFDYKIKFPDAGVFWYHPHIREDYTQPLGLYGNYIVTPTDENFWSPVNQEWPITVNDLLMGNGQAAPFNSGEADHTLMGRYGNTFFVNGNTNTVFEAKQGEVVRMYITNVATARPFNLVIPGIKMKLVGLDNGRVSQEQLVDNIILAPSERAIIEAYFDQPGTFQLANKTPANTTLLAGIHISGGKAQQSYLQQFQTLRSNNDIKTAIPNLIGYPNKNLTLIIHRCG